MPAERTFTGVAAAPGISVGQAVVALDPSMVTFHFRLRPDLVAAEVQRFQNSIEISVNQLRRLQADLRRAATPESVGLIEAHLLMLEDPLFTHRISEKIETEQINAEWAIQQVGDSLYEAWNTLDDEYMRERRGDIEDIVRRLVRNLGGELAPDDERLPYDAVLVGRIIPPSTLFDLRKRRIVGLVTQGGSPLSHTAIMARSLKIPTIVGVDEALSIESGETVIIDGNAGSVICSPGPETASRYRDMIRRQEEAQHTPASMGEGPLTTADGAPVSVGANINFKDEVRWAATAGCEFVGLYRTEFDFFRKGKHPAEDGLVRDYGTALDNANGMPVTFRTIDVGTDQSRFDGVNPNLGARGLRFCLDNKDLFRLQLRALHRAAGRGNARILLPFVSTSEELDEALFLIREVRNGLGPSTPKVPVGVMIETPAAAHTCDLMASRVDFFCLGTNDLIQYYLVIDRGDRSRAHLYSAAHPAILRCLHQIATLLEPTGKPITVCGEMATDPLSAAILLGLGFNSLSVSLASYSKVRRLIRSLALSELRTLTQELLRSGDSRSAELRLRAVIAERSCA